MKSASLVAVISVASLLSGCSLIPGAPGASKVAEQANPGNLPSATLERGSIWRSGDGGQVFEPQSTLDDGSGIIATADILSLTFHPGDSRIIYASTLSSGVFKTENGGGTWKHIDFPPQQIHSFILDRAHPDTTMLATGVWGGIGKIFKTEDGGANWRDVYTEPGAKTTVASLAQHPRDTGVIFAGTSGGTVVKSTDGGATWKNIGAKIDGQVTEIGFDASEPYSVYALSQMSKVHYSKDGGKTWIDWDKVKADEIAALRKKASELRSKKDVDGAKKIEEDVKALEKRKNEEKMPTGVVTILPSPFVSGTIFAGTNNGGLYKSADFGKYWKSLNIIESATKFPIRVLTASFANRNEISFVADRAFYKSLNNGDSWAVTQLNTDRPISAISYDPKDSNVLLIGLRKLK